MSRTPTLRAAVREDVPHILTFIRELAEYERLAHEAVATEAQLAEHLFGLAARIDIGVVEQGDAVSQRRFDQPLRVAAFLQRDRRGIPGAAQMHAAVADAGGGGSIGQGVSLHRRHAQDGTGSMPEGCGASGQRSFAGEYPRQGIGFQRRG